MYRFNHSIQYQHSEFSSLSVRKSRRTKRKQPTRLLNFSFGSVESGLDPVSSIIRRTGEHGISKELFQREFIIYLGELRSQRIMEMKPDIENMTLNEFLEYEASISLDFPHYYEDAFIDKYCALPPLLPCFRPSQLHNECGYESPNTNNKVDINSMTIAEYNRYIARQNKNLLNDHSYSFTPQFFAQPPNTPNTPVDKKEFDFDEILDDLFSVGAKNLRRMGKGKVQHGCNVDTSRDTNHKSIIFLTFLFFPATNEFYSICEHDVDLEKEEAEVEDGDDGDTYDMWDITIKDVERIRQFLMPNVPDEIDKVEDEILNVTMVDEGAECNPTMDLEELERLLAKEP
ncbi:hypothetical protein Tco_0335019 [Tanacetum coccineum]